MNGTHEVPESIIEKIGKLLALKEGASTEAEAALASDMASKLMAKQSISIGVLTDRKKQNVNEKKSGIDGMSVTLAEIRLAHASAKMMDCGCYYRKTKKSARSASGVWRIDTRDTVYFYGLQQNVEATEMVYSYLHAAATALFNGAVKEGRVARIAKRGYMNGMVARIATAIGELKTKRDQLAAGESLALVHLTNQLLTDYANKIGLKTSKASRKIATEGWQAGYADGGRVDIHGARSSRMLD